jgi:hypothetical protein
VNESDFVSYPAALAVTVTVYVPTGTSSPSYVPKFGLSVVFSPSYTATVHGAGVLGDARQVLAQK